MKFIKIMKTSFKTRQTSLITKIMFLDHASLPRLVCSVSECQKKFFSTIDSSFYIHNAKNSMLEIVHFPLKPSARPKQGDETQGRFRVYFSGLLDPIIYKEGRSITALGTVTSSEDGKIGEHEYNYPVLKASYIHLWKDIQNVDVRITQSPFWNTPSYWRHPHYSNQPRRVVIRKSSTSSSPSAKKKK